MTTIDSNKLLFERDQLYISYDHKSDKPNELYICIIDSSNTDYPGEYPQVTALVELSRWELFKFGCKAIISSLGLAQF